MELIILAVPFVTNVLMFVAKKLAGLAAFHNGAAARPWLRFVLVLLSFVGVVATSALTGNDIDPDSISNLALILVETVLASGAAHYIYRFVAWIRDTNTEDEV